MALLAQVGDVRGSGRRLGHVLALATVTALFPLTLASAADTVVDLGTFPDGSYSLPGGLNALGQVVGAADTAAGERAFLWDPIRGLTDLGTLSGRSAAAAVNTAGQVTGASRAASRRNHAFLWDAVAGMRDLGTLPGGSISAGYAISASGQVAGEANTSALAFHAVVWDPVAGIRDLGLLPGGSFSAAYGINDAGQVVGEADVPDPVTGDLVSRGFVWSSGVGMTALPVFPDGTYAVARAINNHGQVVGYGDRAGGVVHAFRWDPARGLVDLGTLGGSTWAYGMSDSGLVVGEVVRADGSQRGFVWEAASGMRELAPLPGGSSSAAYGVNDSNQVAGRATNALGEERAVRWQLNRPPVGVPQSVATLQDTPVAVRLAGSDPDGDALVFTVDSRPAHGVLTGTAPALDYMPAPGFTGTDRFTFTVSDGRATSGPVTVTVTVAPAADDPLASRMRGDGHLERDGRHHRFAFRLREKVAGQLRGLLAYQGTGGSRRLADHGRHADVFLATSFVEVQFSDVPGVAPGRRSEPRVDTVVASGVGRWNGVDGHTFELRAQDAGEPGVGRDAFALTVKSPAGSVVLSVSGVLAGGNIQSARLAR